jgi:hypothetical protein
LGHQPNRARFDGAIGLAWQGRSGDPGTCANPSASWTYVERPADATDASPAASMFDGILAVRTMWTKSTARHLAPRST